MQAMTSRKDNHSAKDFWSQFFARLAESDLAAVEDPDHDRAADEARVVEGLTNAGWNAETIQFVLERQRMELANAPDTSPGVNPLVEVHLARLSDDVEWAMDRLGMASHAKSRAALSRGHGLRLPRSMSS